MDLTEGGEAEGGADGGIKGRKTGGGGSGWKRGRLERSSREMLAL